MALETIALEQWDFWLEGQEGCERRVTVPHTWNVEDGLDDFWGTGWYRYAFTPKESWRGRRVWVYFGAVYHDAAVYLNGKEIGTHQNSGYTPFAVELTEGLRFGEENRLEVCADNRFSEGMLPYRRSFDWANDGGLIRPVRLYVTGQSCLGEIGVEARPVILSRGERQDEGAAVFGLYARLDRAGSGAEAPLTLEWELYEGCDGSGERIASGCGMCGKEEAVIPGRVLEGIHYWHFDRPALYTVRLVVKNGEQAEDIREQVFGFREFRVRGNRFFLNGEAVRLCGTEWMPGSDPQYGMAEPKEQLEKMLCCLKGTNCVFTRFHWQQDDAVYDWCDRHGMLVQEEVPFWGMEPPRAGETQLAVFRQQIREMVRAHRNHPSIIFWGVGNELDAQDRQTVQYIRDAVSYAHELDPERAANYVSNSVFKGAFSDGTRDGDVMMVNDYIGTWHGDLDQYGEWVKICAQNPGRAKVPSEFGLCEPAFSGGDETRNRIFLEKIQCYRRFPDIAGTVNFCLNDYRTQMGEDGEGRLRKRVHGSTDLYGSPKPSWYTLRRESSPLAVDLCGGTVRCRADLPCYMVKGYRLEAVREEESAQIALPTLRPGEAWTIPEEIARKAREIRIFRPNGERVL